MLLCLCVKTCDAVRCVAAVLSTPTAALHAVFISDMQPARAPRYDGRDDGPTGIVWEPSHEEALGFCSRLCSVWGL